ncbi:42729_t:CDS:2, partial [Gigaspora margarita]
VQIEMPLITNSFSWVIQKYKIVIKSNLFQPAPQNYKPGMENIEDTQIQQTSNLLIMGTQVFMTNRDNAIPLSLPTEESLVAYNDIPLFEDIEIFAPVTENPNQIDHPVDSEKDYFCQIRNNLLVRSN